jgi:hypothetical protein
MSTLFRVNDRVRVLPLRIKNGDIHPHARKTGVITHIHSPIVTGQWTAHVLIDKGFEDAGRLAIISFQYLEKIT